MTYLSLKALHMFSMIILFGFGLGSAWYKWMADRSGDINHIAATNRRVVLADWIFTSPTIVIQPLSGISMVTMLNIPFTTPWIMWSFILYVFAGMCWLPVVWLQIQMKKLSEQALLTNSKLNRKYWVFAKLWFWLGVAAFIAMVLIVLLMIFKFV